MFLLPLYSRSRPVAAAAESDIGNLMTAEWIMLQSSPIFWEKIMSCIMKPEFGLIVGRASLVICKALARVIFSSAESQHLKISACEAATIDVAILLAIRTNLVAMGITVNVNQRGAHPSTKERKQLNAVG